MQTAQDQLPQDRFEGLTELEWLRQRVQFLEAELGRVKYQQPYPLDVTSGPAQRSPQWYTTYGD